MVDHWLGGEGGLTEAPGKDGQIWPKKRSLAYSRGLRDGNKNGTMIKNFTWLSP